MSNNLTDGSGNLRIFENFVPLKREAETGNSDVFVGMDNIATFGSVRNGQFYVDGINEKKGFLKLPMMLRNLFKTKGKTFDVLKYFAKIKKSLNKIDGKEFKKQSKIIADLKERAQKARQDALIQRLDRQTERMDKELLLVQHKFNTFIEEKHIVEFSEHAPREIRLDWIKNFTRVIPMDVQEELDKIEATEIFDNYVILHYDPDGTGAEMTEEEKETAKDPILFGVLRCSRRLYYIGDWIDEYCDLTLDTLVETLALTPSDTDLRENNNIAK